MEAIERLAYVAVRQSQDRNAHGFGICYDTSGMAAAPRLSPGAASRARAHAQMEAFERRAIDHWWQGRLPAKRLPSIGPVDALTIIVPQKPNSQDQRAVVIAWAHTPAGRAYGFAAGSTLATAFEQAITELSRNHCALSEFRSYQDVRLSLQEKRLLHFAGDAGTRLFDERAVASFGLAAEKGERGPLRLVVDEPIQGPWSKYAVVWRCLYEGTSWMSSKEPNAFAF
jgi:ribosomal protein S12 methylthiotransferase accessory factor YcaO